MTTKQIEIEILKIQTELQIKDKKIADLIGMTVNSLRNCKNPSNSRNLFTANHLEELKKNLRKEVLKLTK